MREVLARFRAGDEAAVREIHQRYAGAVRTVARSMLSDPELVADVVQETFIKAWRAASTFDEDRELSPWLYSIARRTAIDTLRRQRAPVVPFDEGTIAGSTISFERTWEVWQVRQAIDDLPTVERDVVRLSHLVGLTHEQIADRLGVPVGTVKSRSGRAHRRLAAALQHLESGANHEDVSHVQGTESP